MLTFGSGPASGGSGTAGIKASHWERILSGSAGEVDVLSRVALPPEYGDAVPVVFIAGTSRGAPAIWNSNDNGRPSRDG
jgi:hypothetical protein